MIFFANPALTKGFLYKEKEEFSVICYMCDMYT
jgi:hypothetical protein